MSAASSASAAASSGSAPPPAPAPAAAAAAAAAAAVTAAASSSPQPPVAQTGCLDSLRGRIKKMSGKEKIGGGITLALLLLGIVGTALHFTGVVKF